MAGSPWAGRVGADGETDLAEASRHPLPPRAVGLGVGDPRHAARIGGADSAELLEVGQEPRGVDHASANIGPMPGLRGVYNILATPFKPDESIDEPSLRRLVEATVAAGVDGITVLGVAGEAQKLT